MNVSGNNPFDASENSFESDKTQRQQTNKFQVKENNKEIKENFIYNLFNRSFQSVVLEALSGVVGVSREFKDTKPSISSFALLSILLHVIPKAKQPLIKAKEPLINQLGNYQDLEVRLNKREAYSSKEKGGGLLHLSTSLSARVCGEGNLVNTLKEKEDVKVLKETLAALSDNMTLSIFKAMKSEHPQALNPEFLKLPTLFTRLTEIAEIMMPKESYANLSKAQINEFKAELKEIENLASTIRNEVPKSKALKDIYVDLDMMSGVALTTAKFLSKDPL